MSITVILFEDNDRLRQSLTYLLNNDEAYEVIVITTIAMMQALSSQSISLM